MNRKKLVALLLALSMVCSMSLTGCGNSSSESDAETSEFAETGTSAEEAESSELGVLEANSETMNQESAIVDEISVAVDRDPGSAVPWGTQGFVDEIYQPLAMPDGMGGDLIGILMKDYEQIDDVTYVVTLYDYIEDSAGNHLTASDVVFSYEQAIETGLVTTANCISEVTALSDYEVQFVFNNALEIGQLNTAFYDVKIVTQAAYEASEDGMANDPVGTGPYVLTDFVSGSYWTLERNENYWQTDELNCWYYAANADKINYLLISETAQQTIALETGNIDICVKVPTEDVYNFQEGGEYSEGFVTAKLANSGTQFLMFNCSDESLCSNQQLRQAIAYAIDYDAIIEGVAGGDAVRVGCYGNSLYPDYNPDWEEDYYTYDPEKAAELLAESGCEGATLHVLTKNDTAWITMCELMQAYLEEIGITLVIDAYEMATVNSMKYDPTSYDMMVDGSGSSDYIVNVWSLYLDNREFSNGTTLNFVKDDTMQAMLENLLTEEGHTQENVDEFHYYLADQAYVIGLYQSVNNVVYQDWILEPAYSPTGGQLQAGACIFAEK